MSKISDRIVVVSKRDQNVNDMQHHHDDDLIDDNDYDSYDRWSKGNDRKTKVLKFKESRSR